MKTDGRKQGAESSSGTARMLTVSEACQLLHVHSNTLRRWSGLGIIKAYRIGGIGSHRRYRQEDVVALLVEYTKRGRANGHE